MNPPDTTVLLTGFEPFGGETLNPSWEAVRRLDGWSGPGFRVVAGLLPCEFGAAREALDALIDRHRPQCLIAVGQAGKRAEISVERIAINVDDARIPDNAGRQPIDQPVVADGPAAYFATLPIKAIVHRLRAAGIPAGVSQTAGTFVCNHVFYAALHTAARRGEGLRAGFIHIPYLPEQAARHDGAASLGLELVVQALQLAVHESLHTRTDLRETGGATD
jgi:pyroglutamyl-peptidase